MAVFISYATHRPVAVHVHPSPTRIGLPLIGATAARRSEGERGGGESTPRGGRVDSDCVAGVSADRLAWTPRHAPDGYARYALQRSGLLQAYLRQGPREVSLTGSPSWATVSGGGGVIVFGSRAMRFFQSRVP